MKGFVGGVMKKKIIAISVVLFAVAAVCLLGVQWSRWNRKKIFRQLNQELDILQSEYNTDIMIYGNVKIPTEIKAEYRVINRITEEALEQHPGDNIYHMVAIVDCFDSCPVTDEELELLKRYCEEKQYCFFYVGEESRGLLRKHGFWESYEEDEVGFSYSGYRIKEKQSEFLEENRNAELVYDFFKPDMEGSKYQVWDNIWFSMLGQMRYDLNKGK